MKQELTAPFPWFGGKSKVADIVRERFGDVKNYVEPFAGSLAVLLRRPHDPKTETVNDLDGMIANFWRAVQADAEAVAHHADWPVNEADLHARHYWLVTEGAETLSRILSDPDAYDAKIAGWWAWGACAWIGSGWCSGAGPWVPGDDGLWTRQLPHVGNAGMGINRQLPHVGNAGRGINRQLPHVGNAGRGINRSRFILDWMLRLQHRLRDVRVAWGDWSRVLGSSVTTRHGITGVFLDPPYSDAERHSEIYSHDSMTVATAVHDWALANGADPKLRIALCGYEGEHILPGWTCVPWKAKGGYGSQGHGAGRANAGRERIWFSPHCLGGDAPATETVEDLFGDLGGADLFGDIPEGPLTLFDV